MADKLLEAACAYLGVKVDRVLSWKADANEVVLVVDKGIAGCPKYRVERVLLDSAEPVVKSPPVAAAPPAPKKARRRK